MTGVVNIFVHGLVFVVVVRVFVLSGRSVIYTDANFCRSYAFFGQVCVSSMHFEKCQHDP